MESYMLKDLHVKGLRSNARMKIRGVLQGVGVILCGLLLSGAGLKPGELLVGEAVAYRLEGRRFQQTGQFQEALTAYRKALIANPRYAEGYNDLGVVLEALGDLDNAESAYKTALQLDPKLLGAHSNLALLYERKGIIPEAARHWAARVQGGTADDPWTAKARQKLIQYKLPVPESPETLAKKQKEAQALQKEEARKEELKKRRTRETQRVSQAAPKPAEPAGGEKATKEAKKLKAKEEAILRAIQKAAQMKVPPAAGAPALKPEEKILAPADARRVAEKFVLERESTWSQSAEELYQRAVTAMRQGRYEEAVTLFQQVLVLRPDHTEAVQGLKRAQTALDSKAKTAPKKP